MKSKITKVLLIEKDGRRVSLRPDILVEDVETYRRQLQQNSNATIVLFNIEEIPSEPTLPGR